MPDAALLDQLATTARECDEAVTRARARLVDAVRAAAREGVAQRDIARAIGRSQPEVSRLVRFHGTSPRARTLRRHRREVIRIIEAAGGSNVRVFGSVATGTDTDDSDIDLLFTMGTPLGLLEVEDLRVEVEDTLGIPVDLVPDRLLNPVMAARVEREEQAL